MRNQNLRGFCESLGHRSLAELHPSFVYHDPLRLLIRKERMFLFPAGSTRLAVDYEWSKNHKGREDRVCINPVFWY